MRFLQLSIRQAAYSTSGSDGGQPHETCIAARLCSQLRSLSHASPAAALVKIALHSGAPRGHCAHFRRAGRLPAHAGSREQS